MNSIEKKQIGTDQSLYVIPALEDNYIYLLACVDEVLVVDPGDGKKVLNVLEKDDLMLKTVLITHHHADHTGGNEFLVKKTGCLVIGPEDHRIPHLEQSVDDGEELLFGAFTIEVIATPGHAKPHVVYFFRDRHLLFGGDLLFGAGCGRLLEGTAQEMRTSLEKVAQLPDTTQIFFGHEYTLKNLEFAHFVEPDNLDVQQRLEQVRNLTAEGKSSTPSTLAVEKMTNPFLRIHAIELKKAIAMPHADPDQVFTHLRGLRDHWQ